MAEYNDAMWATGIGSFLKGFAEARADKKKRKEERELELGKLLIEQEAKKREEEKRAEEKIIDQRINAFRLGQASSFVDPVTQKITTVPGMKPEALAENFPTLFTQTPTSVPSAPAKAMPSKTGPQMTPALQKELAKELASYEQLATEGEQTQADMANFRALNENSYGGIEGGVRKYGSSKFNLGQNDPKLKNTLTIVSGLKNKVTQMLKSTFPGAISNEERKYLEGVLGAAEDLSVLERDIAMGRISEIYNNSIAARKEKVDSYGRFYGVEIPYKDRSAQTPAVRTTKPITKEIAAQFLKQAGGDKEKARQMATEAGYSF